MTRETTGTGANLAQPVLFGKYELVERLGNGGMAEVWRARIRGPAGFTRSLVVKRILPHLATDSSFVGMFISEAQLSAKLSHPNIIQVFELGEVDGEYYIAIEYVRGRDLSTFSRAHLDEPGAIPPGVSAYIMREVCRALAYAHEFRDEDGNLVRLIHRDVSPSNVMLSHDGAVKLLDFGIAKALAESGDRTQTGTLKGKFAYMAPEQLEGNDFDHRADIFAAGVILHEILVGKRLFRGHNDLKTIALVKSANVEPPSQLNPAVPQALDGIALKALARDPAQRYQSASDMAADLDEVVHQLKAGPQVVAKLMASLFANEARPRLAAVAPLTPSASAPKPAPAPSPTTSKPTDPADTVIEISASYTGVATATKADVAVPPPTQPPSSPTPLPSSPTQPAVAQPTSPSAALPTPGAPTALPVWTDPTESAVDARPSRRAIVVGSVAAGGIVLGLVLLLRPSHDAPRTTPAPTASAAATAPPVAPAPLPATTVPAPKPAGGETVTISFSSLPSGVAVYLDGEDTPRGRTPLVLKMARAKAARTVRMVARGYAPISSQFTPTSDVQLTLNLVKMAPPKRPVARPAATHAPTTTPANGDGHQLVDPFDTRRRR